MSDWGYLNARLRGMKSRLLSAAEYEKLLQAADVRSLAEAVAATALRPALEAARIRHEGLEALEAAFKADFAAASRKVLAVSDGERRRLVAVLVRRWDVFNVKTVLRAKHSGASPVELLRATVPAGELDTVSLQELAAVPGVKEVADLLATWGSPLAEPLVESLDAYQGDGNLVRLELALDRAYFAEAARVTAGPGRNKRLVGGALRAEIDLANIMAKVRLVLDDIDTFVESDEERRERLKRERREADRKALLHPRAERPRATVPWGRKVPQGREQLPAPRIQEAFVPGGAETGGKNLAALLRCRTMGELLAFIARTSYGRLVSADMRETERIPDLAAFERALEAELIRRNSRLYRREDVGAALAVSYLWLKHTEYVNLRVISRGKEFHVPEGVLRGELVLP